MLPAIPASRRRLLRARAQRLKPAVQVGKAGLTEPLLAEINAALTRRDLIKIRFTARDGDEIDGLAGEIVRRLGCVSLGRCGFVVVFCTPAGAAEDDNSAESA